MVRLKQGSTVAANLSWDTENDGRFEFDVAASIPEGNYSIEVQSVDRSVKGESGVFRVSPCTMATVPPPPLEMAPQITNVHPNYEREITYVGGHFLVTWETRGRVSDLVNITLHPPDRSGRGTFLSTARAGARRQLVRIPPSFAGSGAHAIRVGTTVEGVAGWGKCGIERLFLVTEPTARSVWHPGERVVVRWTRIGAGTDPAWMFSIALINPNAVASGAWPFAASFPGASPGDGELWFNLPADVSPGIYYVIVGGLDEFAPASDHFRVEAR
jgi:hypothetical protein